MIAIFHIDRTYPKPRYHRGEILNGMVKAVCGGLNLSLIHAVVDTTGTIPVYLQPSQCCGNCFRDLRKVRVEAHASGFPK